MCGITGIFQPRRESDEAKLLATVTRMNDTLLHRGPDNGGAWVSPEQGIALAMRRLAIVDLSPAGQQPMHSASGQWTMVFNGEIYNHLEIRKALDIASQHRIAWRGHSDTEILLNAIECWGMHEALSQAVGMFAFALWDGQSRQLTLGRDRMGEKPLYYGWSGDSFVFGSELKALRAAPGWQPTVSQHALSLFMRHGYIPAPDSIYEGVFKLPPAMVLTLSISTPIGQLPDPQPYWQLQSTLEYGHAHPFQGSVDEAQTQLEALLRQSIAGQMIADVPLGAFLSGGVDSSLIVALMQAQANRPVRTFTVGFGEAEFDESPHARAVAQHLHTDHTELHVSEQDALAVVPQLPMIYDEPFADSSQIPTYIISKLTRQHVTVSLSGDAGDELFAGYTRYQTTRKTWRQLRHVPLLLRQLGAASYSKLMGVSSAQTLAHNRHQGRLAEYAKSASIVDLYANMVSLWQVPEAIVNAGDSARQIFEQGQSLAHKHLDPIELMMWLDMQTYLPDDILVKVDRAAMAASLETRVPFLDHRLIQFVATLPLDMKVRAGQTKWLLRKILYQHVPQHLIERPKQGFAIPIGAWLRGALREWATEMLSGPQLAAHGYLNIELIQKMWSEHIQGRRNWQYHLWSVLMFQAWFRTQ